MPSDSEQASAPTAQSAPSAASPKRPRAAAVLGWAGLILAALGWWLSFDLLRLSEGLDATNPLVQAQCGGQSGSGDCLSVLRSERAKGPLGIPWAAVGMGYFAFVGVWYVFVGVPQRGQRRWLAPVALLVAAGLLSSAQLVGVMAVVLKTWCFGCLLTHGVNAALAIVTTAAFLVGGKPAPIAAHPAPRLAAATLLAAFSLALLNVTFVQLGRVGGKAIALRDQLLEITEDAEYIRMRYTRQAAVDIPLRDDEPWVGDADAPNTLVAFTDFQCPICAKAAQIIADALQKHSGRMRVTYRNFPQDSDCNPHYPRRFHPAACNAARAAEAARLVGGADKAHQMRSLMYQRQRELEANRYQAWASEIGLDATAFAAAMQSNQVDQRITEDMALGGKLGLEAMPVLFLNGRRLRFWQSAAIWDALLSDIPATQPAAP